MGFVFHFLLRHKKLKESGKAGENMSTVSCVRPENLFELKIFL